MTDENKEIYCNKDYDKLFAEKCYKCKRPIVPTEGSKVAPKLRALGHDYHPDCFKCEVKYIVEITFVESTCIYY